MVLAKLRPELNIAPSSDPQRPGLLMSDHYRFSQAFLVVPPLLTQALSFFDGTHTITQLEQELSRIDPAADAVGIARQLSEALDGAGFLENATFAAMRDARLNDFWSSPVRKAAHVGGYPADPEALHQYIAEFLALWEPAPQANLVGIAAPHVSPHGGKHSYGAAYGALSPELRDRIFIILGTSHYGAANRFGLTRKPFETPFGVTKIASELVDELAVQPASIMEDYCHAIEHSIEFQVLFLQHLYGADVKILPILCGSFYPSIHHNGMPEDDQNVAHFFSALRETANREGDRLCWILGVDMAHIGVRYGDSLPAYAEQNHMVEVRERDEQRIGDIVAGNAAHFWNKVKENGEDLRWCGSSPFYTFMQALPQAQGRLRHYEQWNIDPQSVVSFAGISFTA
jgi:AmmeMemoRadiSam system protein B